MLRYTVVFISVAVMAGCSARTLAFERAERLAQLQQLDGCDTLLAHLKDQAISKMEQQLDETLAQYMSYNYCGGYRGYDGYYGDDYDAFNGVTSSPGDPSAGMITAEAGGESATEYSETNNQVQGVAEADFVKNDGSHIYILADGRFQIVDAWPADQAHVLSSHVVEGEPKRLFVHQDRALIYSSLEPVETGASYGYYGGWYGGECTYGYNCDFTGDGRQLKITVLDISDRAHPVIERELRLTGAYLNARRVGAAVHTAVVFPPVTFSAIQYYPEILNRCWSDNPPTRFQIYQAFRELKWENRRVIATADIRDWMPSVSDTRFTSTGAHTTDTLLESCENYYKAGLSDGQSFLTLLSLDMTRPSDAQATTVVGRPGAVYASAEALYISARQQSSSYTSDSVEPVESSTVHKFRLVNEPPGCSYVGSGVVKGRVLSQFSMDEFDGDLRIATTTGHVPSPDVHSTMTVLAERDGRLVQLGVVDDIAPTEDIRSVRFNGKTAFIVTFKKTDPLFTFDLSDPAHPRIAGELKIPGYSTYMHLLGPDHLLTIGYDAEDHDSFAYFQGLMLQIFDISDLADPRLIHKEIIGTRGSTSDAATNHLAFNYFAPKELLAIPTTVCEDSGGGGSYGDTMTFSGLLVYDVSVEDGFSLRGGVAHVNPDEVENHYSYCSNWWTDSNSIVKRSIFMDDFVYSVAPTRIKIQDIDALGEDLADLNLAFGGRTR